MDVHKLLKKHGFDFMASTTHDDYIDAVLGCLYNEIQRLGYKVKKLEEKDSE